jgi:energy-coupling factor transport system permease protein
MLAAPPRPGTSRRPILWATGAAAVLAVALNVLLSHTGATALVTLPGWLPLLGGPLTAESILFGGATAIGLAAGLFAVAPLALQLEPDELLDVLPRGFEATGAALATTLGLGPGFARALAAVREAQTMRGWRPRGPRSWAEVVVPVCLTAMEDSLLVAEAMEARAFGSGPRTAAEPQPWSAADVLTAAVAGIAVLAFIGARLAGRPEDWAAYPTPAPPPADPLLLAAAAALALPAFLRWRSPA